MVSLVFITFESFYSSQIYFDIYNHNENTKNRCFSSVVDRTPIGLRICVIIEHNGKIISIGLDFKYEPYIWKRIMMYDVLVYLCIVNVN